MTDGVKSVERSWALPMISVQSPGLSVPLSPSSTNGNFSPGFFGKSLMRAASPILSQPTVTASYSSPLGSPQAKVGVTPVIPSAGDDVVVGQAIAVGVDDDPGPAAGDDARAGRRLEVLHEHRRRPPGGPSGPA